MPAEILTVAQQLRSYLQQIVPSMGVFCCHPVRGLDVAPSSGLYELTAAARESHRARLNQVAIPRSIRGHGIAADPRRRGRIWAASQGASSIGTDTAIPAVHLVQLFSSWGFEQVEEIHWPGKTYESLVMTRPLSQKGT